MSGFLLILLWIGVLAIIAKSINTKKYELVEGVEEERLPVWFAFLIIIPLVLMTANRIEIGDTYNYKAGFIYQMPDEYSGLSKYMAGISKDSWFYLLSALIKIFITKDYIVYFAIIASIQLVSVFLVFRKYSTSFILSAFLFIASADYISWAFNGIRQFFAVSIIFAATFLLLKKKYLPLILIILLASQFHQSALIMLPIVFFVQGEAWGKKNILLLLSVVIIIVFIGAFTEWLNDSLQGTQYHNVVSDYNSLKDDGANPLRVAVFCVPSVIAFIYRKKIRESNNNLISICVNMSIVTSALYLVSMVTSGLFIGRLPIYTSLYNYILLPWEIKNLFEENSKRIILVTLIVLYLVFYIYQIHFSWSLV